MATFPSYAVILNSGYGEKPDYGVLRTPTDAPLAKQRPRWTLPVVTRSVIIEVIGKANKVAFDAWAKTDIGGAAGWFTWVDPLDEVSKQARIVAGDYEWGEPLGPIWRAQCKLETLG